MPIEGRSFGEAGQIFCDHLNDVLHSTVSATPLSFERARGKFINIRMRGHADESGAVLLRTRYGELALYLAQLCEVVRNDSDAYVLHTLSYRYAIGQPNAQEPLLRWEYLRTLGEDQYYNRHHLQGPVTLDLHNRETPVQANLQDWHLPTGWVPFEDVLRFCIVDLGVNPLSDNWNQILEQSYRRFRSEFSSPGR